MIDLIRINSNVSNNYSDLRNKAGKVVEVVGLLLGFIVVAVVELPFENYACVNGYLTSGFTLTLFFLLVSVSLGLIVCLDTDVIYSTRELTSEEVNILVKHFNKSLILLNFSIFFCLLGLFSVISIIILLLFKSLDYALYFVTICFIATAILMYIIAPYLESQIKKEN